MLACMELVEENSQSPPLEEAAPVELTYDPCYDDLPVGEIV